MLPLGPPDRARSPYKASLGFRGLAGVPGRPGRPGEPRRGRRVPRARTAAWIEDWAAFAGGTRAVNDQVRFDREWAALRVVRRRTRRASDRRRADLRRARERRPRRPPGALPRRRRRRRAAGLLHREGPALGQPDLRLAGAARAAATAGGSSASAAPSSSSTSRGSTTSAASRPTGRSRAAPPTRARRTWVRGPGRAPFDAARAALGSELPIIAEDLGVITPPVVRLRDDARLPRHGRPPVRASTPTTPTARTTSSATASDQVLYTGTHDNDTLRGWYEGLPEKRLAVLRAAGVRGRRALVGAHRARPGLGGAAVHAAGAGRARARQRGADEPARDGERELGVPAGAGAADEAPREAVAGGHGGRGAGR